MVFSLQDKNVITCLKVVSLDDSDTNEFSICLNKFDMLGPKDLCLTQYHLEKNAVNNKNFDTKPLFQFFLLTDKSLIEMSEDFD